jgi:hypothetical protein
MAEAGRSDLEPLSKLKAIAQTDREAPIIYGKDVENWGSFLTRPKPGPRGQCGRGRIKTSRDRGLRQGFAFT